MRFESPIFLLLLGLLPFILPQGINLIWHGQGKGKTSPARRDERSGVLFSTPVNLASLPHSPKLTERAWVLSILRILAFMALVFAVARPQTGTYFSEIEESGRDIMLALDISGSMRALDFFVEGKRVERLTALKTVVQDFIDGQQGDRIGLVIFGSDVFTQCPLTSDLRVLKDFVKGLEIGMVGDGTALGDGLGVAIKRLREIKGKSKVIVLVTDGVKTAGNLEPKDAAEIAKKEGIKIHTIGIGGKKPAPFKVTGLFGQPTLQYLPVELDEKTMKEIAQVTGGKYFNAEETEGLKEIYAEIAKLESRIEKTVEYTEYEEQFLLPLIIGLLLFMMHELLAATRYSTVP